MSTRPLSFNEWFNALLQLAHERKQSGLIDASAPRLYREYFDDGDTPAQCLADQLGRDEYE